MLTLLVDLVWLTLLAGIELGGLRFKHRPGSESTTTGKCLPMVVACRW